MSQQPLSHIKKKRIELTKDKNYELSIVIGEWAITRCLLIDILYVYFKMCVIIAHSA